MKTAEHENERNLLSDIERIQLRDVQDYLQRRKHYGHRPQTTFEIIVTFDGLISERAVLKQLERLKKWDEIKTTKVKVQGHEITFISSI
jgi:hypothetical protein